MIPVVCNDLEVHLRDAAPIGLQVLLINTCPGCNLLDGVKVGLASNFQIRLHCHSSNHDVLATSLHTCSASWPIRSVTDASPDATAA